MEDDAPELRRGPKPRPQTRETLIAAGMRLLHDHGYAATGLQEIVKGANVPKGSFYNHFPSKEAFAREVVDQYFASGLSDVAALLNDPALPPLARLRRYFQARAQGYEDDGFQRGCLMGNLALEVADHSPPIRDSLAAHFDTWAGLIASCIAEAQGRDDMVSRRDPAALARFILNGWEGALLAMRVQKTARPLEEFQDMVFDVLLA